MDNDDLDYSYGLEDEEDLELMSPSTKLAWANRVENVTNKKSDDIVADTTNSTAIETTIATAQTDITSDVKDLLGEESSAVSESVEQSNIKNISRSYSLDKQYTSSSGARLVNFTHTTGADDNSRRAYFYMEGSESAINLLKNEVSSNTSIQSILSALSSSGHHFTNFILTGLSENFQEKQMVVATIGDYYTAMFAGQDPHIISITGLLPFDASRTESSWFINFINAYSYLFRASKLALYKLKLKLVIPDYCDSGYVCYPISFVCGLNSESDNLIQFQMSLMIVDDGLTKAFGISETATEVSGTSEEVSAIDNLLKTQQTTGETNSPSSVGTTSQKKNFLDTCTDFINTTISGAGTSEAAKAINTVNKVVSSISQVQGAINVINGKGTVFGSRIKLFGS